MLLVQCKTNTAVDKEWEATKRANNFSDYAEFLQKYPTSIYFEEALAAYFVSREEKALDFGCGKFNMSIDITNDSIVLLNQEPIRMDALRTRAFHYLKDGYTYALGSLHRTIVIPETQIQDAIAKGHFDVVMYDKPFPLASMQSALLAIGKGIEDYKGYLAKQWYGKPYSKVTAKQRLAIDSLNSKRLSFFDFSYRKGKLFTLPPPPPELNTNEISDNKENE